MDKHQILRARARFLRAIREYFFKESVIEVDTPILSQYGNPDPALLNFVTQFNGPGKLYQAPLYAITSPEYHMKRLLADGFDSCYYLGKVFRDGELSARHNPEFTMVEWYRLNYDLEALIKETITLVETLIGRSLGVIYYSYREAFETILGLNPFTASLEELIKVIEEGGINLTFTVSDRDEALDLIVSHLIEPAFAPDKITILAYYPASQASLAKVVERDGFSVGKRFELYYGGLEMANGYEELTESGEQRRRFEYENHQRIREGYEAVPIDEALLAVLDDLPFCSGVALGVDRLFMAKKGLTNIGEAIPFPFEEA